MINFLVRILGNSVALYGAFRLIPGFSFTGGIKEFLMAGVVLGLLNLTVRPILKFVSFPIIILTLGLFTIVINALILWLVDYIFKFIEISDVMTLLWTTIVVGIINAIISGLTKTND